MTPQKKIVWHHSAHHRGIDSQFSAIDNAHKNRFRIWNKKRKEWSYFRSLLGYYVGYHFFIDVDGKVTQCRSTNEWGAHTYDERTKTSYNDRIGICIAMNGMYQLPTKKQYRAAERLVRQLGIKKEDNDFHRELDATLCPGIMMNKDLFLRKIYNGSRRRSLLSAIKKLLRAGKVKLAMKLLKTV